MSSFRTTPSSIIRYESAAEYKTALSIGFEPKHSCIVFTQCGISPIIALVDRVEERLRLNSPIQWDTSKGI
jgi:hypothetical protein